ncbi:hypothetical protein [Lewinella cohaerens]|uniref:hypothetical protein n=1 Tax=Lewinella cohaerens TaxID=70995 RepID=UPI00037EA81D|nr:hypothetical protein [Lewinella cohaerens]
MRYSVQFYILAIIMIAVFSSTVVAQPGEYDRDMFIKLQQAGSFLRSGNHEDAYLLFEDALSTRPEIEWTFYMGAAAAACGSSRISKCSEYLHSTIDRGLLDPSLLDITFLDEIKKTDYWSDIVNHLELKKTEFLKDFQQISRYPIHSFIPFEEEGKFGYMLKDSNLVLVDAKFLSASFPGNEIQVEVSPNQKVIIDRIGNIEHYVRRKKNYVPPAPPSVDRSLFQSRPFVSQSLNVYGFSVTVEGKIDSVGSGYIRRVASGQSRLTIYQEDHGILYRSPFRLNNKWYVCAKLGNAWAIVDEAGNKHYTFPDSYKTMSASPYFKVDAPWFIYTSTDGAGFVNENGETKFFSSQGHTHMFNIGASEEWDIYVIREGDLEGVVDLRSMEWLVKPISGKIKSIRCTFVGDVNSPPDSRTDDVIDLFIKYSDVREETSFYVGAGNQIYRTSRK